LSNEKPSGTKEIGTVCASPSRKEAEHQVKSSVKRIVRCKYIRESTKDKNNCQTQNGFLFMFSSNQMYVLI